MDKILLNKLIESKNFTAAAEKLGHLHPADIAEFLKDLDSEDQAIILKLLDAHKAGDALSEIDSEDREELLDKIGSDELTRLLEFLPADDTTDILSETPDETTEEVLTKLTPKDSAEIEELLSYDEDSASGIMDPELLAVPEVWTVGQTLEAIKNIETDEPIYYVYVVDYQNRLVGFVKAVFAVELLLMILLMLLKKKLRKTFLDWLGLFDGAKIQTLFSKLQCDGCLGL